MYVEPGRCLVVNWSNAPILLSPESVFVEDFGLISGYEKGNPLLDTGAIFTSKPVWLGTRGRT